MEAQDFDFIDDGKFTRARFDAFVNLTHNVFW